MMFEELYIVIDFTIFAIDLNYAYSFVDFLV